MMLNFMEGRLLFVAAASVKPSEPSGGEPGVTRGQKGWQSGRKARHPLQFRFRCVFIFYPMSSGLSLGNSLVVQLLRLSFHC